MKTVSENVNKLDLKTLDILDKVRKLIVKGNRFGFIPYDWKKTKLKQFKDIEKFINSKHTESDSKLINDEIKKLVVNLENAVNKSKVKTKSMSLSSE